MASDQIPASLTVPQVQAWQETVRSQNKRLQSQISDYEKLAQRVPSSVVSVPDGWKDYFESAGVHQAKPADLDHQKKSFQLQVSKKQALLAKGQQIDAECSSWLASHQK
jgi:hypothetical protein